MNVTEEKGWEVKSESAGVHTDHRLSVMYGKYGKPDGRAQKIVISDRFISNDPRNRKLFINNIHKQ